MNTHWSQDVGDISGAVIVGGRGAGIEIPLETLLRKCPGNDQVYPAPRTKAKTAQIREGGRGRMRYLKKVGREEGWVARDGVAGGCGIK